MISCKGCGANMHFDPASQMLKCDYCGKLDNPQDLESQINATDQEMFDTTMFSCPQCGATLFSDEDTAATFCSYCGSSVIIEGRAVKMKAPSYVIPFKKTKEMATDIYKKFVGSALYAPSYMKQTGEIKKLRGIYMPYWVYEMGMEGPVSSGGATHRRSGDYIYTKNYRLTTQIRSHCNGTGFDASSSFSDELSQSIAPYNFRDGKSFSAGYLSGFYVDSADVEASVYEKEAVDAFANDVAVKVAKHREYSTYGSTIRADEISNRIEVQSREMAYFPVWFIANENKGYVSYAVINGQTGKIAADIPIDYKKYIFGSLLMALPIMGFLCLLTIGFTPRPFMLAIATIIFAFISMMISNGQLNLLHTRQLYLDDKGLRSVRNEKEPARKGNKKTTVKRNQVSPLSSISTTVLVISSILFGLGSESDSGMFLILAVFGLFTGVILKIVSKATTSGGATVATNSKKAAVYAPPMSQKMKILIKPIIAMVSAFLLLLVNPYMDIVYYCIVFGLMALVLVSFYDVVNIHNQLTRRLPRQFGKRGGDESEIDNF